MCGLAALFEPGRAFRCDLLDGMEGDVRHRGPDSAGRLEEPGMALVFRRLAILDPRSVSDQPMTDPSGRFTLVYNGEIYNYRALRAELSNLGVRLRTDGDTEAILQGYALWGEKVLDKLEGMFAFVLVDREARVAVAARDPFGIKPLYVHRKGRLTAFASEMRPLTRLAGASPDPRALAELLTFRFASGRLSNLAGIEKLPGGHVARLSLVDGSYAERRFADPLDTFRPDTSIDADRAVELAGEAIRRSVRDHLQSDIGYALQLSGGVDSSLVAALAMGDSGGRVSSFGIALPGQRDDEAPFQRMVAARFSLDHHELAIDNGAFADVLLRAVHAMEGPLPHFGCALLMLLCERIRDVTKVVLTGEGADELFGGYMRYRQWRDLRRKGRIANAIPHWAWPWLRRWREIERFSGRDPSIHASVMHDTVAIGCLFPQLVPVPGTREETAARFSDFRERMFAVDQTAYLESLLMRQDKMAMAAGVEARVPFTHWPLAKAINAIPASVRAPGGDTKPILKRIAESVLPVELVRRRKVGLRLPLREWLADGAGFGRYLDDLASPESRLGQFCDRASLRRAVEDFRNGRREGLPPLDHLVNVELWLRSVREPASFSD